MRDMHMHPSRTLVRCCGAGEGRTGQEGGVANAGRMRRVNIRVQTELSRLACVLHGLLA